MTFSRFNLLLRNLRYFRAANLAVVAGMAVATAVLAGALMVGDSVRGSLGDLALARLDWVDHALVSPRLIDQSLADRIAKDPEFIKRFDSITPGLLLRGGAETTDGKSRTAGVQIAALRDHVTSKPGVALINEQLAKSLGISASTPLRFSLPAPDEAPKDAPLARRGRDEVIAGIDATASSLVPTGTFPDLFNLTGEQRTGRNAWLQLSELQDAIDKAGKVNLLLVRAKSGHLTPDDAAALNQIITRVATLSDLGLDTSKSTDKSETVLSSTATYIHPALATAAQKAAKSTNTRLRQVSVYLLNRISKDQTSKLHYAIAAGISELDNQPLADDEAAVNQWTAERMGLKIGDRISFDYYIRKTNGDLEETWSDTTFKVATILPMTGIGADPTLTPEYQGLTDTDSIAKWKPPPGVIINKDLVTKEDEAYWTSYRAAPKIFVSLSAASKMWGNAFGDVTSLRIPAAKDAEFTSEFRKAIDPAALGLVFRPIKAQQLAAASGSTDFAMLFIGFSFFLLVAATLLVAMLFRLSVEQRARQLGLLSACGFAPSQLRNLCLTEGLILAVLGGILGLAGAIAYTALIVHGLRTWWVDAIGTTALRLHVNPLTLIIGLVGAVAIALFAITWAVRRVTKTQPARLLAGALVEKRQGRFSGPVFWKSPSALIALVALLGGITLLTLGFTGSLKPEAGFLGGGSLFLLATLAFLFAILRPAHHATRRLSYATLATRNATRNRTRSLLCIALIALASFTLVTVSSMQTTVPQNTWDNKSGAGGYTLIASADIPLLGDLNTANGREVLAIADTKNYLWDKARFVGLRTWAGQDISCLNITRPDSPTILAAPAAFKLESRFTFAKTLDKKNGWDLLEGSGEAIPVIADSETAAYILKLSLGDTMPLTDATGKRQALKLVATLSGSIFQSQLLMSESNFARLFPAQSGFATVLVDCDPTDAANITKLLNSELADYSLAVETTADRLHAYHQVANTYLSTFQLLGSLGLMLGTIGLAVVLVRNLIERRAELALLSAIGFNSASRTRLVFLENAALLLTGLVIGTLSALAGVIPNTFHSPRKINIPALSIALALVLVIGLAALLIAIKSATRRITPAALRAE